MKLKMLRKNRAINKHRTVLLNSNLSKINQGGAGESCSDYHG